MNVEEFKNFFDRGQFDFGEQLPSIRDKDITKAYDEASSIFNPGIFPDEDKKKLALLYLTAHFLEINISGGSSAGLQSSRSAGSVSESLTIPEWVLKNPLYSSLSQTPYGQKYILLVDTYAVGSVLVVGGNTLP